MAYNETHRIGPWRTKHHNFKSVVLTVVKGKNHCMIFLCEDDYHRTQIMPLTVDTPHVHAKKPRSVVVRNEGKAEGCYDMLLCHNIVEMGDEAVVVSRVGCHDLVLPICDLLV
jgi:hypothetical protein